MTLNYVCDSCGKSLKEDKDWGGKAMVYAGRIWRGKRSSYKHYHYCKKCFNKRFMSDELSVGDKNGN